MIVLMLNIHPIDEQLVSLSVTRAVVMSQKWIIVSQMTAWVNPGPESGVDETWPIPISKKVVIATRPNE